MYTILAFLSVKFSDVKHTPTAVCIPTTHLQHFFIIPSRYTVSIRHVMRSGFPSMGKKPLKARECPKAG